MIYITGDTHGDFKRFTKKQRNKLPFEFTENDYVIVCGDFGLLWAKDKELEYNLDWLSRVPFTLLWVQGNHENYNMIAEYPIEEWNGGKVRHIVRDKIILLERGQVFTIENKTFFTFGGASSHDIQGGILDKEDPSYHDNYMRAVRSGLPFRELNVSWWSAELPNEEELQEGKKNLSKAGYQVDYVITHCASNYIQLFIEYCYRTMGYNMSLYEPDVLTNYFDELEDCLQYKHWYCGHYHQDMHVDEKHTVVFQEILPLQDKYSGNESLE